MMSELLLQEDHACVLFFFARCTLLFSILFLGDDDVFFPAKKKCSFLHSFLNILKTRMSCLRFGSDCLWSSSPSSASSLVRYAFLQLTTLIVSDSSSDWLMSLREISSQSQELTVVHILSYPSLYPLTTMMMTKRTTPFVLYYLIFPSFVDMTDPETLRECHEVSWRQNTKMGSERMLAKDIFILQRCYERTERWSWWWWCWKRHED